MISIAICDDEIKEIERTQNMILKYSEVHPQYEIKVKSFFTGVELLSHVEKYGGIDIIILDIYMTGMLGIEAAKELRQIGDNGEIIFITTSRDHAIEAFEVDAAQYLVKPYNESTIFSVLNKILGRLNIAKCNIVTLKTSDGIIRFSIKHIVYTETGRNNYQIIHTIQGKPLEVRMTTSELFKLLAPSKYFVRCGASINLNLKFIRQIRKDAIILDSGEHLRYPYMAYKKLKDEFLSFQMSMDD